MAWSSTFEDLSNTIHSRDSESTQTQCHQRNPGMSALGQSSAVTSIGDLQPGTTCQVFIGTVIGKDDPKAIQSKNSNNKIRFVLSFTIRDSPQYFINCTSWGDERSTKELAHRFRIGDVVELRSVSVQAKPNDGSEEKFRRSTPSSCTITMNDLMSSLLLYTGPDLANYQRLLHVPVKASHDYITLQDLMSKKHTNMDGKCVNILAAVQHVRSPKEVKTKTGREMKCCEIFLFDQTGEDFLLTLWDSELIDLVQSCIPKNDVLFAADIRCQYNDFRKMLIGSCSQKSTITPNPDTPQAHRLYRYAQTADVSTNDPKNESSCENKKVDLSSISTVYTVAEVLDMLSDSNDKSEYGIIFAVLTACDLDAENANSIVAVRCNRCHWKVNSFTQQCTNPDCPSSNEPNGIETHIQFEIPVNFSDHSGTISGMKLIGDNAQNFIGCQVEDFLGLGEEKRTALKWEVLLEYCKVYFQICKSKKDKSYAKTLSCGKAEIKEMVKYLK